MMHNQEAVETCTAELSQQQWDEELWIQVGVSIGFILSLSLSVVLVVLRRKSPMSTSYSDTCEEDSSARTASPTSNSQTEATYKGINLASHASEENVQVEGIVNPIFPTLQIQEKLSSSLNKTNGTPKTLQEKLDAGILEPNSRIALPFENENFVGTILFVVATKPFDYHFADFFRGKKRVFEVQMQGRFKKKPEGVLFFGVELQSELKLSFSARILAQTVMKVVKRLSIAIHYSLSLNQHDAECHELPHLVFPLWRAADNLFVTKSGEAAPQVGVPFREDDASRKLRRGDPEHGVSNFNTSDTYSFSFHSMYLDLPGWRLSNLKALPDISLRRFLGDLPLSIVIYDLPAVHRADPTPGAGLGTAHLSTQKRYFLKFEVSNTHSGNSEALVHFPPGCRFQDAQEPVPRPRKGSDGAWSRMASRAGRAMSELFAPGGSGEEAPGAGAGDEWCTARPVGWLQARPSTTSSKVKVFFLFLVTGPGGDAVLLPRLASDVARSFQELTNVGVRLKRKAGRRSTTFHPNHVAEYDDMCELFRLFFAKHERLSASQHTVFKRNSCPFDRLLLTLNRNQVDVGIQFVGAPGEAVDFECAVLRRVGAERRMCRWREEWARIVRQTGNRDKFLMSLTTPFTRDANVEVTLSSIEPGVVSAPGAADVYVEELASWSPKSVGMIAIEISAGATQSMSQTCWNCGLARNDTKCCKLPQSIHLLLWEAHWNQIRELLSSGQVNET